MATRSTTANALDSLMTAADKANTKARADILSTIPDPVFTNPIWFEDVIQDKALNVRDETTYGYERNKDVWDSLQTLGFLMKNPMMSFSRQTNGKLLVISGNIRYDCMVGIRAAEIAKRTAGGIVTDESNPLPFASIHGLVWSGLTSDQEHCLITDQVMAKGLTEFELAKSIGEFWERHPGMTNVRMGLYFGMDKNKVSRLRMRYCMPPVLDEYRKEKSKDASVSFVKVGNEALTSLYSAYLIDREAGCDHRTTGPNFDVAWKALLTDPTVFNRASQDKPESKVKDAETLKRQAASLTTAHGDSPEIKASAEILAWAAGENGSDGTPVKLNDTLKGLKSHCEDLRLSREAIAGSFEKAHNELAKLREEHATLSANYADSLAQIESLQTELDSVRADLVSAREELAARPPAKSRNGKN